MLQTAYDEMPRRAGGVPFGLDPAPQARTLLEQAKAALEEDPKVARRMLDQLGQVLGWVVVRTAEGESRSFSPAAAPLARGGLAAWQIRLVARFVEANLATTIHVDTLANLVRLSTSHFCRAFKVTTGETAHGYIMRLRLEHAQSLMLHSAESLCQIAAACGLADQAHLTRLFRRHTGETPYNWRRTFRTAA